MDNPDVLIKLLSGTGFTGLLVFCLWAILSGRVHTDREFQEQVKRAERFESIAFRLAGISEKLVEKSLTQKDKAE